MSTDNTYHDTENFGQKGLGAVVRKMIKTSYIWAQNTISGTRKMSVNILSEQYFIKKYFNTDFNQNVL